MKGVLIISYYFPPCGGPGSIRVLKFAKYLRDYGWEPLVLTVKEADYHVKDTSLMNEIPPEVNIFRTYIPEPYRLYRRLTGKQMDEPVDISTVPTNHREGKKLREKLAEAFRATLFIPDARVGWLPFALKKALRIIRANDGIQVVFSSAPPFTCHLVACLLKKITGIPWVADYRDPWTQAYFYPQRPPITRMFEEKLECKLLKEADRVVSINEKILKDIREKYDLKKGKKWMVIPNGFDPSDFEDIEPIYDDSFTIIYTGSLNVRMNPKYFLEAVGQLCVEKTDFARDVKLVFVGRTATDIAPLFKDTRIVNNIHLVPHLPHKECLRYTFGADLLLLLIPEWERSEVIMTTKIFEYIKTGRPILALAPEGEAAQLIRRLNLGFVVHPKDIAKIKNQLWKIYNLWKSQNLQVLPDEKEILQFDRKRLTEKLARIFNEVFEENIKECQAVEN